LIRQHREPRRKSGVADITQVATFCQPSFVKLPTLRGLRWFKPLRTNHERSILHLLFKHHRLPSIDKQGSIPKEHDG